MAWRPGFCAAPLSKPSSANSFRSRPSSRRTSRKRSCLAGFPIHGESDAKRAARAIQQLGPQAVLIKGGAAGGEIVVDGLLDGRTWTTFRRPRLGTRHHHGVGATLSSALAAYLALGETLPDAVLKAIAYVHRALAAAPASPRAGDRWDTGRRPPPSGG